MTNNHNCLLLIGVVFSVSLLVTHLPINASARTDSDDKLIIQYCKEHQSDISKGRNPVNDLVKNGTVAPSYQNNTCSEVKSDYNYAHESKQIAPLINKKLNKQLTK